MCACACQQAIQNMVRSLFAPHENIFIFKENRILHGKPLMANLGELGCSATYKALNNSYNHTKDHLENNRVTLLIYLQGEGHYELLNYNWDCAAYEASFGSCANITQDENYAIRAHLLPYTTSFCDHYQLSLEEIGQHLLQRGVNAWRHWVNEKQIHNISQVVFHG